MYYSENLFICIEVTLQVSREGIKIYEFTVRRFKIPKVINRKVLIIRYVAKQVRGEVENKKEYRTKQIGYGRAGWTREW